MLGFPTAGESQPSLGIRAIVKHGSAYIDVNTGVRLRRIPEAVHFIYFNKGINEAFRSDVAVENAGAMIPKSREKSESKRPT